MTFFFFFFPIVLLIISALVILANLRRALLDRDELLFRFWQSLGVVWVVAAALFAVMGSAP